MEFLNLDLDVIKHICEYLNPVDLTMLSGTCSSLREWYPADEAKHRTRFRKVATQIHASEYIDTRGGTTESSKRTRADGTIVNYERDNIEKDLWIDYAYPREPVDCENAEGCELDGGYVDFTRFRKFRTAKDKQMWYRRNIEPDMHSIRRRRMPNSYNITVSVNRFGHQSITICDEELDRIYVSPKRYPVWADDKTDN